MYVQKGALGANQGVEARAVGGALIQVIFDRIRT